MISCLVSETHKLIFLWSSKAASTSVKGTFYNYVGIRLPFNGWQLNNKKWQAQQGFQKWEYPPNPSEYLKIQFARNPYERAVSIFLFHSQYTDVHSNCKKNNTFTDFLTSVKNNRIKCNSCRFHSKPQLMTCNIDEIVKVENLPSELTKINKKYNLKLRNVIFNDHSYRRQIRKQIIAKQPVKNYSDYLTPKAIDLINQIYSKDIEHFGYQFRYPLKLI